MRSKYELGMLYGMDSTVGRRLIDSSGRPCVFPFSSDKFKCTTLIELGDFIKATQEFTEFSALDVFNARITIPFLSSIERVIIFKK